MTILIIILKQHLKLQSKMNYVSILNGAESILIEVPTSWHRKKEAWYVGNIETNYAQYNTLIPNICNWQSFSHLNRQMNLQYKQKAYIVQHHHYMFRHLLSSHISVHSSFLKIYELEIIHKCTNETNSIQMLFIPHFIMAILKDHFNNYIKSKRTTTINITWYKSR